MIDSKIVKKMLRDALRRKDGLKDHKIMHPEREWFSGLFISVFLLAGLVYWSLTLYWQFSGKNPSGEVAQTTPVVVYREGEIKRAINVIDLKMTEYNRLKAVLLENTTPAPVPDPSTESVPSPIIEEIPETTTAPEEETGAEVPILSN